MKNKKLLIIISAILAVVVAVAVVIVVVGSKSNKYGDMVKSSAQSLTSVTTSLTISDKGQTVYAYEESLVITGVDAEITKKTSKLNSSYELSTSEQTSFVEGIDRNSILNFVFNKSYFSAQSYKNNILNLTVKGDKLSAFLGSEEVDCLGDATAVFTFENENLKTAEITYLTQSNKTVKIVINCLY
jgi:hypothetical protein